MALSAKAIQSHALPSRKTATGTSLELMTSPSASSASELITNPALDYPLFSGTKTEVVEILDGDMARELTPEDQAALIAECVSGIRIDMATLLEQAEERPLATYNAQIFDLGDAELHLKFPLLAVVEHYPDEVIARLPEYDLYATAVSDSLALAKLKVELSRTYRRLQELGPERLGPLPLQWWHSMERLIEGVRA